MDATLFWNTTIPELKQGYTIQANTYTCLICSQAFEQGIIYNIDGTLCDAKKAIQTHIATAHPDIFDFYLSFGRVYTGLSQGQTTLAKLSYSGLSDKDIMDATGAGSISTIRNQRFAVREKYKQAKILVTLVELMEEKMVQLKQEQAALARASRAALPNAEQKTASANDEKLVDFHPAATCIDERYAITQKEKGEVLARYFDKNDDLIIKNFPAKEKKKIIILQKLMDNFAPGRHYTEPEINDILQRYYEDFVTVRRYLIQYGFMARDKTGENYRVNLQTAR
ncbi:MAG: DUF2087 domain-containing protein [Defluviitaleaceae bacterium]|nr:DUF2087 domain-containing protein [Defluviitaleaceae bacterium]